MADWLGSSDAQTGAPAQYSPLVQYFRDMAYGVTHDPLGPSKPFPWSSVLPSWLSIPQSLAAHANQPPTERTGYTRAPRAFDGYPYVMRFLRAYNGGPPVTSDDLVKGAMGNLDPRVQAARGLGDILNTIRGAVYPPAGESQDIGDIIEGRNRNISPLAQSDSDLHA